MDTILPTSIIIYSRSLNAIADTNPINVLKPTVLALPISTASGIIAEAIMVNMAPDAKPSKINHVGLRESANK